MYPTSIPHLPPTAQLATHAINAIGGASGAAVESAFVALITYADGRAVDRGDYVFVVTTSDGTNSVVSSAFTIDVDSCPLNVGAATGVFGELPYGLIRTRQACEARGGTVAYGAMESDALVCCAPEVVTTTLMADYVMSFDDMTEPPTNLPLPTAPVTLR